MTYTGFKKYLKESTPFHNKDVAISIYDAAKYINENLKFKNEIWVNRIVDMLEQIAKTGPSEYADVKIKSFSKDWPQKGKIEVVREDNGKTYTLTMKNKKFTIK